MVRVFVDGDSLVIFRMFSAENKRTTSDTTASANQERGEPQCKHGASRAREAANCSTSESASGLHRPPVSTPSTSSWHRSLSHNSTYFVSLSCRASANTAPSTVEAFDRARPHAVTALRTVISTASRAPWFNSIPEANTSIASSSVAGTLMFMSRNLAFRLTVEPASRHTRARVCSVGTALERRRRCWSRKSREPPHSHLASVINSGNRTCGTTTASRGTQLKWAPRATLGWHMVQSVIAHGPGRQHTTGQAQPSPESGVRN